MSYYSRKSLATPIWNKLPFIQLAVVQSKAVSTSASLPYLKDMTNGLGTHRRKQCQRKHWHATNIGHQHRVMEQGRVMERTTRQQQVSQKQGNSERQSRMNVGNRLSCPQLKEEDSGVFSQVTAFSRP